MWVAADTTHGCTRYPDHGAAEDRVQLTPARTRHRVAVSKVVSVSGQVPGVAINVRHHITSQVAVGDQSPLTQPPQYPHSMTSLPATGDLELSWHLAVPTLPSYILLEIRRGENLRSQNRPSKTRRGAACFGTLD